MKSTDAASLEEPSKTGLNTAEKSVKHHSTSCLSNIGGFFCGFLVRDDCRSEEDTGQQQANDEDALFCTLCNAEVDMIEQKMSYYHHTQGAFELPI